MSVNSETASAQGQTIVLEKEGVYASLFEKINLTPASSLGDINAFLDKVLVDEGIPADRLALVGFSQGTMMALSVAPQRDQEIAGVVGFSGRLIDPEQAIEARVKPPILLIHARQQKKSMPIYVSLAAQPHPALQGFCSCEPRGFQTARLKFLSHLTQAYVWTSKLPNFH